MFQTAFWRDTHDKELMVAPSEQPVRNQDPQSNSILGTEA